MSYPEAITWLYSKLTTPPISGVSGVYENDAPEGATTSADTWIEFEALNPGVDVTEVAEQRIWTEYAFLVRAITRGRDTIGLGTIATEIDNRLHRASGTTSGGQILQAARQQEEQDHWLVQGIEFRGLGGIYNLIVQPA
jgi:hypothetical protein